MSVKIMRKTGILGMGSSLQVYINGEKTEKIKSNQKVSVDIPEVPASLQLTQYGVKTNQLTVYPGDEIEVTTRLLGRLFLPTIILSSVLTHFLSNLTIRSILSAIMLIIGLLVFAFFFVPGGIFQIQKLDA